MRKFLIGLLLVLTPSFLQAQVYTTLSCGSPADSFTNAAIVDTTAGTGYALYSNLLYVTWQTSFAVAPSAVSLSLQGSIDGSAWSTIDTSTATAGDIRNVAGSYRFVRAYVNSHTGGSGMTVSINCTRQSGGSSGSGYSQIEEEGSALTKRTVLNFEGAGSTCVDDTTKTTCTITSGGGGAPTDAQYVVAAADGTLSAERVCTDTATIDCDAGTAAQMKFNLLTNPNLDWTGSHSFLDANFSLKDNTTPTKILKFELSGLTAATTRTYTAPDLDGTIIALSANGFGVRTAAGTVASRSITAGTGVVVANGDGVSGNPSVGYDSATTPQFSSGTGSPPGTCTVGQTYLETDVPRSCECSATNTWVCGSGDVSLAGTPDYITISGQTITRGPVDLAADVTGDLPLANVAQASGASVLLGRGSAGGAGDFQEVTLGTNLSMSGTTLNASGGSSFDPSTAFTLYDDFLTGYGANVPSGGNANAGSMNWGCVATGSCWPQPGTTANPGLLRLSTGATDNDYADLDPPDLTTSYGGEWTLDVVAIVASNGGALTDSGIYVGLADTSPERLGYPTYGIYIRRDTDRSDTTFVFQLCDSSAASGCQAAGDDTDSTVVASTITPSAGTAYRFRIRRVTSGVGGNPTIYMRVNDETEKTFCSSGCDDVVSNASTSGIMNPVVGVATRTTTAKHIDIDYVYHTKSGLTRY